MSNYVFVFDLKKVSHFNSSSQKKTGKNPLLANRKQGQGTSIRMTFMEYEQTKYSQVLLKGLHRPTIKGLYSGQIRLVDRLQKTTVDCSRDFIYILNMSNPGAKKIHEKTLEEHFFNMRTSHGKEFGILLTTEPTLQQLIIVVFYFKS